MRDRAAGGVQAAQGAGRERAFATVRADGRHRLYAIDSAPLAQVDAWLSTFRQFWEQRLDALDTELRRGRALGGTP